jgi:UDP:flavonoid glycosyltransferase YjiC (YdhE family)
VPLFADQGRNAQRVAEIGASIALRMPASILAGAQEPPEGIADAVSRVLEGHSYREAAQRVAAGARVLPPIDGAPAVLAEIAEGGERRLAA